MRDDKNCIHQWFEIKKIKGFTESARKTNRRELNSWLEEEKTWNRKILHLGPYLLDYNKFGVLIKCAVCNEQKELWEDEK